MNAQARRELELAVANVHFMWTYPGAGHDPDDEDRARADGRARRLGMKALKPPPQPIAERTVSAARRALLRDRKLGIVDSPCARPNRSDKAAVDSSWFDVKDRQRCG